MHRHEFALMEVPEPVRLKAWKCVRFLAVLTLLYAATSHCAAVLITKALTSPP